MDVLESVVPREAIMFNDKYPGKAVKGYFASTAWLESEEKFNGISGNSFGWYDFEDKVVYKDDKHKIRLMTPEEYSEHKHLFED